MRRASSGWTLRSEASMPARSQTSSSLLEIRWRFDRKSGTWSSRGATCPSTTRRSSCSRSTWRVEETIMTSRVSRILVVASVAAVAMVLPIVRVSGQMPVRAPRYAITNARIVTAAGTPIEKGTVVMRDGIIEDVGASVTAPADALVVDGSGLMVYPGLIDMSNNTIVEGGASPAAAPAGAAAPATQTGRGRGTTVATPDNITWADQERESRIRFLHPDVDASK